MTTHVRASMLAMIPKLFPLRGNNKTLLVPLLLWFHNLIQQFLIGNDFKTAAFPERDLIWHKVHRHYVSGLGSENQAHHVPYNIVPVFSPICIPFFNFYLKLSISYSSLPEKAIIYLLTWFLLNPVALLSKLGFTAVAFGSRQLNRCSLIQEAKVANRRVEDISSKKMT